MSPKLRNEDKLTGLRRSKSQASIAPARWSAAPRKVLRGGDVSDFFNMKDDDIAEEDTPMEEQQKPRRKGSSRHVPSSAPMSRSTSMSSMQESARSPTNLPHPLADARTHGALGVARIAAKHDFDLVYIVNVWPENAGNASTVMPASSPTARTGSARSSLLGSMEGTEVEAAAGMNGRLLAAYGLSHVASPFRISAAVHAKILRHEGWIEYRENNAKEGEFSRGYGHAFHAGPAKRPATADPSTAASEPRTPTRTEADRGIVFAAYRQPGPDGKTKACTREDLEALQTDAAYLIDMLIAIHKAKRLRKHSRNAFSNVTNTGRRGSAPSS